MGGFTMGDGSDSCARDMNQFMVEGIQNCPFLRNLSKPSQFLFAAAQAFPAPLRKTGLARGPIFEEGADFGSAFEIFHGQNGIVPLSENKPTSEPALFHPLAATATISLSSFGGAANPFGFDAFMKAQKKPKPVKKPEPAKKKKPEGKSNSNGHLHEAMGDEWLASGNCPIAKSYRAVAGVLPLAAKLWQPPSGMNYRCPPAIVAARAALARTAAVKALRPQSLPTKVLAIGLLGVACNIPLGVWREHVPKFSPSWFVAVHASVPFIAMLRKAVLMPKHAMAFTIAASILGQVIGSRAERIRLRQTAATNLSSIRSEPSDLFLQRCGEPTLQFQCATKLVPGGAPAIA